MEILFISYKYPPEVGGMQKQSYELINGVSQYTKVHKLIKSPRIGNVLFFLSLLVRVPYMLYKNPNINLIHLNDGACALLGSWIKLITNAKVVMTYHGLDLVFPSVIYQKYLLNIVKKLDGFICVSEYTADECKARGFQEEKIFVIPNGVDLNLQIEESKVSQEAKELITQLRQTNKRILISIGRPVRRKGFSWFVKEVLTRLDNRYRFILIGPYAPSFLDRLIFRLPDFLKLKLLLLFGKSSDGELLEELSNQPQQKSKFTWLKNCNYPTLLYLLRSSDLFVMPNIKVHGDCEGFGLVTLESVVSGTPVAASRIEGITSAIIHNHNGTLLQSQNKQVWIDYLNKHFSLPEKQRNEIAQEALSYTEKNYSWDKMSKAYYDAFLDILKDTQTDRTALLFQNQ